MNKYKEAFDKIDDYCYGHSINDSHKKLDNDFKLIQELVSKEEKYKWHNVGFDKNDIPKNDIGYGLVEVCFVGLDGILQYEKASYNKDKNEFYYIDSCIYGNTVEAWKITEEFENE